MSNTPEQSISTPVSTTSAKFIWQIKLTFNTYPQSTKRPTSSQSPLLSPSTLKPSNFSNSFNSFLPAGSEIYQFFKFIEFNDFSLYLKHFIIIILLFCLLLDF